MSQLGHWVRSSYCNGGTGACVELKLPEPGANVLIRDSKRQAAPDYSLDLDPVLEIHPSDFPTLLQQIASNQKTIATATVKSKNIAGGICIESDVSGVALYFTCEEWDAFRAGVMDGEFNLC